MGEIGRNKWDELVPELEIIGTLTIVDPDMLGGYCLSYERLVLAQEALNAEHLVVQRGTGGPMLNPLVVDRDKALDGLLKFGAQLGIGAAARSRIEVNKSDDGKTAFQRVLEQSK